jgi:hypothetical protein
VGSRCWPGTGRSWWPPTPRCGRCRSWPLPWRQPSRRAGGGRREGAGRPRTSGPTSPESRAHKPTFYCTSRGGARIVRWGSATSNGRERFGGHPKGSLSWVDVGSYSTFSISSTRFPKGRRHTSAELRGVFIPAPRHVRPFELLDELVEAVHPQSRVSLARRPEVPLHPEMELNNPTSEPPATARCERLRLRQDSEAEHVAVEGLRLGLTARRHGKLHVVKGYDADTHTRHCFTATSGLTRRPTTRAGTPASASRPSTGDGRLGVFLTGSSPATLTRRRHEPPTSTAGGPSRRERPQAVPGLGGSADRLSERPRPSTRCQ